ncbi:MAG: sialidase family protein [bacterium]|nr:sialidase family protein [bacterium]
MKRVYIFIRRILWISLLLISNVIEANSKGLGDPSKGFGMLNLQLRQIFQSDRLGYEPAPTCRDLAISQYKDGDYTFSKNIQVNDDPAGTAEHFTKIGGANIIVARGDTLYIVWSDAREGTTGSQIYFAKSINGGQSFLPNVKVGDMPPNTAIMFFPSIAVDAIGRIYVAWSDSRNSSGDTATFDIYFAKSDDGGLTFSQNRCVTDTSSREIQYGVSIGVAGDNVYIVWADARHWDGSGDPKFHIYSDRSRDGGLTFSKDIKVDDFPVDVPPYGEIFPCINVLDDTVYVIWSHLNLDALECDIRLDKSVDGGVTFGTDIKVTVSGLAQIFPSLTIDKNRAIHIAFYNVNLTGRWQILYAKSTDGGASFSQITEVTDTTFTYNGMSINITTDTDCNPYCVWEDLRESLNISHPYFSYSDDGGNSFSKNVRVVDKPGTIGDVDQFGVGLAVDDNKNVYAVWSDRRNHAQWYDIYFAKGTQAGIEESQSSKLNPDLVGTKLEIYPTPFRQTTSISYQLPARGRISLKAYNLAGGLIEVLIDDIRDCGTHTLGWTPEGFSTGVYFLRLEFSPFSQKDELVNDFVTTKRVVILK